MSTQRGHVSHIRRKGSSVLGPIEARISQGKALRQLRDMRMKIDLDNMTKGEWFEYVEICGWTLARAHARTGDAALIGGYLGTNDVFDSALAKFAASYTDQAEDDHAALVKAIRAGRLKARNTTAIVKR